jgi:beta-mannosidase
MMSAGPWKPIRLEQFQSRIETIHFPFTISKDLSLVTVDYTVTVEYPTADTYLAIELFEPEGLNSSGESSFLLGHRLVVKQSTITSSFKLKWPKLWYPVNYGQQNLYKITVTLSKNDTVLDTKEIKLGFRRARVIQSPLHNSSGTSFYFEINNIPIFCGGSNWIPADTLLTRLTPQKYHDWLSLLVRGNQNMIRAWGGGVYEHDAFYTAADELGILVWQDFLFACGQYPAHPEFLASVEKEVVSQLTRIRCHPCIVLFAGNNEDYQVAEAEGLDWDPMDKDPEHWLKTNFPARYIYEKLLPELVGRYAPGVYYHPGSPWGGGKPTRDPTVGDIHQWNGTPFHNEANGSLAWDSRTLSILPEIKWPLRI